MSKSFKDDIRLSFGQNWGFFFAWGISLFILGLIAIYFAAATTLISVVIIGILFLIAGVVVITDTFQFWRGKWGGFSLHLLMGLLYLAAGLILILGPTLGAVSLTLFLGAFFLVIGIFRIIYSLSHRLARWGWNLFSGIISVLLGILILAEWPASSLFILGLFVGIDLLFIGWTYMMVALAARGLSNR